MIQVWFKYDSSSFTQNISAYITYQCSLVCSLVCSSVLHHFVKSKDPIWHLRTQCCSWHRPGSPPMCQMSRDNVAVQRRCATNVQYVHNMCHKHPWSINSFIHKVLRWISLTSFWHMLTVLQAEAHWFRCFGLWRWFLQAHLASVYWVLAAARCDLIDLTLEISWVL